MRLLVLALLLAACRVDTPEPKDTADTADTDTDTGGDTDTAVDTDADDDGALDDVDCDDTDAAVFPGAEEVCNDKDDDCDGSVDELATDMGRWYDDDDGDGYGVETVTACDRPEGAADAGGDCDDGDPEVNPGAPERCGGGDEDCDGETDEDPVDIGTWYEDLDGDGYGDPATAVTACDPPEGLVAEGGDCDPYEATVNPGAVEVCDNAEIDDDCDGGADDFDPEGAEGTVTTFVDADADGYGDPDGAIVSCDPAPGSALEATDCDDADPTIYLDAEEFCSDGIDQDCDGADDTCPG